MSDPGLCKSCARARKIESAKGSVFWRCSVHDQDASWPKYPPLPISRCPHYVQTPSVSESET